MSAHHARVGLITMAEVSNRSNIVNRPVRVCITFKIGTIDHEYIWHKGFNWPDQFFRNTDFPLDLDYHHRSDCLSATLQFLNPELLLYCHPGSFAYDLVHAGNHFCSGFACWYLDCHHSSLDGSGPIYGVYVGSYSI